MISKVNEEISDILKEEQPTLEIINAEEINPMEPIPCRVVAFRRGTDECYVGQTKNIRDYILNRDINFDEWGICCVFYIHSVARIQEKLTRRGKRLVNYPFKFKKRGDKK